MFICVSEMELALKAFYYVGIILAFVSGVIIGGGGVSFDSQSDFKSLVELASYFSTILVAIAGVLALKSWRSQFEHSEKYKAVKEFQESLMGRSVVVSDYAWSVLDKRHAVKAAGAPGSRVEEILPMILMRKDAWRTRKFQVETCWENLKVFLSSDELLCFPRSPTYADEWLESFAKKASRLCPYKDSEEALELHNQVVEFCSDVLANDEQLIKSSQKILARLVT